MGKDVNLEFKELIAFRDKLQKVTQDAEKQAFMESCARELAARLLAKVVKRTPVGQYPKSSGKQGGTLRRGWTATSEKEAMYNAMFGGGTGATDSTGSQKAVYGKGAVSENVTGFVNNFSVGKNGDTYFITITNPVEYASYVEFGHRTANHADWVEGKFMLTISENEIEKVAPRILEKKLYKWLSEVFK